MAVQEVMQVCGISTISVTIGEVTMAAPLSDERLAEIQGHLQRLGFELVYLQDRLAHEYSALSKFFTAVL